MSEPEHPQCQCGSMELDLWSENEIKTGDGTPVLSKLYQCRACGVSFTTNKVIGRAPDQEGA